MSKSNPDAPRRLALIASKGTLDWAYPPFILASAVLSLGRSLARWRTHEAAQIAFGRGAL